MPESRVIGSPPRLQSETPDIELTLIDCREIIERQSSRNAETGIHPSLQDMKYKLIQSTRSMVFLDGLLDREVNTKSKPAIARVVTRYHIDQKREFRGGYLW